MPKIELNLVQSFLLGFCFFVFLYTGCHQSFQYATPSVLLQTEQLSIDHNYHLGTLAEIKNHWPFQDPRMAGVPYYYHYFLWVHIVMVSLIAHLSLDMIFLRLVIFPLTMVFSCQLFLLGKRITSRWFGGILTITMAIFLDQITISKSQSAIFSYDFVTFLYSSPTFFPGMIYTGVFALLIPELLKQKTVTKENWLLLTIMAIAGCSSKATVMPPLIVASGLAFIFISVKQKSPNLRLFKIGFLFSVLFLISYLTIYGHSTTGGAHLGFLGHFMSSPFYLKGTTIISAFIGHMTGDLSRRTAEVVTFAILLMIYLLGFYGARLAAFCSLSYLKLKKGSTESYWLVCMVLSYVLFGYCMVMSWHAEYYLLFPIQLPLSVLATRGISDLLDHSRKTWLPKVALTGFAVIALAQIQTWWRKNQDLHPVYLSLGHKLESDPQSQLLFEGLHWIRDHTSVNDVLMSNLFTKTMAENHQPYLSFPIIPYYFYYSAVAERRVFLEGWAYWLPPKEEIWRLEAADQIFNKSNLSGLETLHKQFGVNLIIIDKRWSYQPSKLSERATLVFSNSMIEIYRYRAPA